MCNKTFKKQKYLNQHDKDKHPEKIIKSLKLKAQRDNAAAFNELSLNRFIKFKNYLVNIFEKNVEIYIPFNLSHTDVRILKPIYKSMNDDDDNYLGIKSSDTLIIKSIVKCYSKILRLDPYLKQANPKTECGNSILINQEYIPDISIVNPLKYILENYTIEFKKNIHLLSILGNKLSKIIKYKNVFAYNVLYINLPKEILSYILQFTEIIDYKLINAELPYFTPLLN